MRRIDVLVLGLGIFLGGGVVFLALQGLGLDGIQAGIWSQVVMVAGLLVWLATYLFRVVTHRMTLNQQLEAYESAVLEKRLEELSPEELASLQQRLEGDSPSSPGSLFSEAMVKVSRRFQALQASQSLEGQGGRQCALIPFLTAGDPDLETTAAALLTLDRNGADLIELGVPYSDPLADGPVIQAAATRALAQGVTLDQVLGLIKTIGPQIQAPLILFTYYNPILNRGIETFMADIAAAGVAGLVVPDLPLEEMDGLLAAATRVGVEVTLLVAPTSSRQRIAAISAQAQGFIYLVSVTGVTGMRQELQSRVKDLLTELKQTTDKPIGVGFGVSGPDQAAQLKDWGADAVIVGSAFVKRLAEAPADQALAEIGEFCRQLKAAIQP